VEIQRNRERKEVEPCDPVSIERGVRQRLADKVSGNLAGLWLLVAEHLRLGTWDLLCGWTQQPTERVEPRLALQLVHESALCTTGIRAHRTLHSRGGFELTNGLPFVATDSAIHQLLGERGIADTLTLQTALGKLRRASGHFSGNLLAIDPHRIPSYTQRHMRRRAERSGERVKMAQTFWVLDAQTHQPVCFTTRTAACNVSQATPDLLKMAKDILQPIDGETLVVADTEHFSSELLHQVHQETGFDLLIPLPNRANYRRRWQSIPDEQFQRHWAGYATAKLPFEMHSGAPGRYIELVQRNGERPEDWYFKGFISTTDRDEVNALTREFPQRWHVEEFFNANQALGWNRAGTMNLNIRYGQMTMALVAQAVIHQLRQRLGEPYSTWNAEHLAHDLFYALEGDVRVTDDTIIVTYYNAPEADRLRRHYEELPEILRKDNVCPQIPWLYGYQLDFRFR
jgi:hypothetical protein